MDLYIAIAIVVFWAGLLLWQMDSWSRGMVFQLCIALLASAIAFCSIAYVIIVFVTHIIKALGA